MPAPILTVSASDPVEEDVTSAAVFASFDDLLSMVEPGFASSTSPSGVEEEYFFLKGFHLPIKMGEKLFKDVEPHHYIDGRWFTFSEHVNDTDHSHYVAVAITPPLTDLLSE